MHKAILLTCVVIAASAGAQIDAQEHSSTLVFPVVARTTGVGTSRWVSDLTVNNLIDQGVTVGIQFFPENQANSLDPTFPDRIQLGPRETAVIEDILMTEFGYSTNIKGMLVVTVDPDLVQGNPQGSIIAGVTRTYNAADPAGTYGQTVSSSEAYASTTTPLVATGARFDGSFRSNLGVGNIGFFEELRFNYRVRGESGAVLAEGSQSIPPLSVRQWSLQQLGLTQVDGGLTIEVWLDEGSVNQDPCASGANAIIAYISKVDNGTGDAEFIHALSTERLPCDD